MKNLFKTILLIVTLSGCASSESDGPVTIKPPAPPPAVPDAKAEPMRPDLVQSARQHVLLSAVSSDMIIRAHAMESMVQALGSDPVARARIVQSLSDPESLVRFAAAMSAGQLKIEEARQPLLAMVNDPSRNVCVAVRFALHKLGDSSRTHDLEKYLKDPSETVQRTTVVALGMLGEPSALKLLRPMQPNVGPELGLQIAEARWRLNDSGALESLAAGAISRYPDDQIVSLLALAAPLNRTIAQHIRPSLTSEHVEVRLAAARAMGMLGSDEGYTVAMRALPSTDPRQRALASLALGAIGRSDAQDELAPLLTDPNPDASLAAATAILQLKSIGLADAGSER